MKQKEKLLAKRYNRRIMDIATFPTYQKQESVEEEAQKYITTTNKHDIYKILLDSSRAKSNRVQTTKVKLVTIDERPPLVRRSYTTVDR